MFKLEKSEKDNMWYFSMKSANNEIIVQSEGYTSRAMAIKGMVSVLTNSAKILAKRLVGAKWYSE